ncbi:thioredoxin [Kitasatospora nipponensis]|uniref:Thioredoxin n=1 Tax=Kitasatospora nipponensis TaxID=258049 RepID=A0ABP4HL42_9ACTN
MAGATITVTDATFDAEVLKSGKPVLVDFWAEWCGPCKQVAPVLEALAEEYGDQLTVAKIDVDNNQAIPAQYGVISIPTLNVYVNGEVVKSIVGARPKAALLRELADIITIKPAV